MLLGSEQNLWENDPGSLTGGGTCFALQIGRGAQDFWLAKWGGDEILVSPLENNEGGKCKRDVAYGDKMFLSMNNCIFQGTSIFIA